MLMQIKDALKKLDVKNDNHWTDDGLPRVDTIRLLVGDQTVTREHITREYPTFNREFAKTLLAKGDATPDLTPAKVKKVADAPAQSDVDAAQSDLQAAITNLERAKAILVKAQAHYDKIVSIEEDRPDVTHSERMQGYLARQTEILEAKAKLASELRESGFNAETLQSLVPGVSILDRALRAKRRK